MSKAIQILIFTIVIVALVKCGVKKGRGRTLDDVSPVAALQNASLAPTPRAAPVAAVTSAPAAAEAPKPAAAAPAPVAPVQSAPDAIIGRVVLNGKPPADKVLPADADAKCKLHSPNGIPVRNFIVDGNGGLANVLVYVKEGIDGKKYPPSASPVLLDQQGCVYNPLVVGVQVGQTLVMQNSDDTMHNVHGLAKKNPEFNIGQPKKGDKAERKFDKAEVFLKLKCDVHPWMSAFVGVVESPFFAVTQADGSFKISGLPAGEYTLVAVHPKAGESKPVKVKAGGTADFEFKP